MEGEDSFEPTFFLEKEQIEESIRLVCSTSWEESYIVQYTYLESTLNKYQEQPMLIAPSLPHFVEVCMNRILEIVDSSSTQETRFHTMKNYQRVNIPQIHVICKLLRIFCKVRGAKYVLKLFPHEVNHFEVCLYLLRAQDQQDFDNWETIYILFNWLTILSLIPFDICSIDSTLSFAADSSSTPLSSQSTLTHDIIQICKDNLSNPGPIRESAALCLATLLTRPDMDQDILHYVLNSFCEYLESFNEGNENIVSFYVIGILQALAQIFKKGHRNHLLHHAPVVLGPCLKISLLENNQTLTRKLVTKLVQWLGAFNHKS